MIDRHGAVRGTRGRTVACVAVAATALLMLSGCTPPTQYGVRLNSDATVDFVICSSTPQSVEVDYRVGDSSGPREWIAEADSADDLSRVVRYGSEDYTASVSLPVPDDWTDVELNGLWASRSELEEGEWTWFTETLEFVPDLPCETVSDEELAR